MKSSISLGVTVRLNCSTMFRIATGAFVSEQSGIPSFMFVRNSSLANLMIVNVFRVSFSRKCFVIVLFIPLKSLLMGLTMGLLIGTTVSPMTLKSHSSSSGTWLILIVWHFWDQRLSMSHFILTSSKQLLPVKFSCVV